MALVTTTFQFIDTNSGGITRIIPAFWDTAFKRKKNKMISALQGQPKHPDRICRIRQRAEHRLERAGQHDRRRPCRERQQRTKPLAIPSATPLKKLLMPAVRLLAPLEL
jgi:hypothetical protein